MPRRRGAQQGNRNALSHGFYATALSEAQRLTLDRAKALSPADLDEEIAMLRARLAHLIEAAPDNIALLSDGLRTLVRLVETRHRLKGDDARDLAAAVERVLDRFRPLLSKEPHNV